ncbi:Voltage gated chloride channel family protein [Coccidioides posadasii C735 delta SOWgp]|uniref:Voltage gated chloride channel family protein n=1 Tax=Coccidioides posadasii (strain C735) TaxID=222929 RepID=C5PBY0_COCP7|nr:Voltage gated chloride channel family protein [Coccidioides posadasii C735 delta SOWgp]EER25457.1 Voltage gated chloride channel family protein [Coccidioides posadasii C735 delta SOWgp]|eukprot:XP_003067602.1 Voltage gated chloride channel family protein [Coccidioides posadasii C735 delta SOWgp]
MSINTSGSGNWPDPPEQSSSRGAEQSNNDDASGYDVLNNTVRDSPATAAEPLSEPSVIRLVQLVLLRLTIISRISFKRKQKSPVRFGLYNPFSWNSPPAARSPSRPGSSQNANEEALRDIPASSPPGSRQNGVDAGNKVGGPLDWYIEGPGRRVGYDNLTAIDWIFEYTKERQRIRHLRSGGKGVLAHLRQLLDAGHVWAVLIATGIVVGVLAACIDIASSWLGDLKVGFCRSGEEGGRFYLNKSFCCWGYEGQDIQMELRPILFAGIASFLVTSYAIHAKHSGIPEIKTVLGGFVIENFMGLWTLMIKSLGLCLSVASGMWLGKEGPLVHVACCCANIIMKPLDSLNHNEARKREVLSAAAAAGISVAFGSPIGGVLFSLEQLSYYFPDKTMWQSFVCAMVAAVTLHAFDPFRTGKIVLYQVEHSQGFHRFEIFPFIFLGILGGLYGGLFIKLNMRVARWRKSRRVSFPVLEVLIVALITAVVNFPNILMRVQLSELVYYLFADCKEIPNNPLGLCKTGVSSLGVVGLLLSAAALGFFLAIFTFGLDIPAGIILPSLAIGALYGRAVGIVFDVWQKKHPKFFLFANCEPDVPCVTPGMYAIIGAASALGGATRMTVSIVVIMFELTGALNYAIPIMIAVMLSKWCGDTFGKRGVYESWIHLNDYPFLDQKDDTPPPDIPVSQVMTNVNDLTLITAVGHTIESLTNLLKTTSYRGYPVVSDTANPLLLGYISRNELSYALKTATSRTSHNLTPETQAYFSHQPFADPLETLDLRPWMDQTPITMNSRASFQIVLDMFQRLGLRYVLFVNRGVLEGFLTKKDIWYILEGVRNRRNEGFEDVVLGEGQTEEQQGLLHASADHLPEYSHIERRTSL